MLDPQSLIMRPDSLHRGEIVTDSAIHLIADGGCRVVTLRALADRFNMTPRGVQCWFGTTEKMWENIAACYGRRWVGWILDRPRIDQGVQALLPTTSEEVAWTRVWLALGEEGRQRPAVGDVIAFFEQQEVDIVQRLQLGAAAPETALAVIRGLRHAVCAGTDPMTTERAQQILTKTVEMFQSCDAASLSSSHSVVS